MDGLENLGLSDEQLAAVTTLISDETEGLTNKNQELLNKLKSAKTGGQTMQSELEELRQFKAKYEQDQQAAEGNYQEALVKAQSNWDNEKANLSKTIQDAQDELSRIKIDNGLSTALDKHNVNKALKPALISLLKQDTALVEGKAVVLGKPLNDYIDEWAKSEDAKVYINAPVNNGGGDKDPGSPGATNNPFDKKGGYYNVTEQAKLMKADPAKAAKLQAAAK